MPARKSLICRCPEEKGVVEEGGDHHKDKVNEAQQEPGRLNHSPTSRCVSGSRPNKEPHGVSHENHPLVWKSPAGGGPKRGQASGSRKAGNWLYLAEFFFFFVNHHVGGRVVPWTWNSLHLDAWGPGPRGWPTAGGIGKSAVWAIPAGCRSRVSRSRLRAWVRGKSSRKNDSEKPRF